MRIELDGVPALLPRTETGILASAERFSTANSPSTPAPATKFLNVSGTIRLSGAIMVGVSILALKAGTHFLSIEIMRS